MRSGSICRVTALRHLAHAGDYTVHRCGDGWQYRRLFYAATPGHSTAALELTADMVSFSRYTHLHAAFVCGGTGIHFLGTLGNWGRTFYGYRVILNVF